MDQAPGPIIARVRPSIARIVGIVGSPDCDIAIHTSVIVTIAPASGVHKPISRSEPAADAIRPRTSDAGGVVFAMCAAREWKRAIAVIILCRRSPVPGQPLANVENRRCIEAGTDGRRIRWEKERPKVACVLLQMGELQFDDSAL